MSRSVSHRALGLLMAGLTLPSVAKAQVVRGTATDEVSRRPLAGVLVGATNARTGGALAAGDTSYTLTNSRGEYALRLPGPGSYTLTFKRIGVVRRIVSLSLGAGQARRIDVALDPLASGLPLTLVSTTNLCLDRPEQLRSIVALWEEARTVLRAAEITERDELVVGWLTKYKRTLLPARTRDGASLRILDDHRTVVEGSWRQPMRSIGTEQLTAMGFWGAIDRDTIVFQGPDASVLLAPAFQRDYCFVLAEKRRDRQGLLGIDFRPRRGSTTRGITGTMWLDMLSFELRFVEFRYLNLIVRPFSQNLGGEVHFVRHDSGGWVVQRWLIRMPRLVNVAGAGYPVMHRVLEEGGSLYAPGLRSPEPLATVSGTVLDSTGQRPLPGAVVSLSGTPFTAATDTTGAFRFDSIIPGAYVLLATNADYAQLGQLASDESLNLKSGQSHRTAMRARSSQELKAVLCEGQRTAPHEAVLRVFVSTEATGLPLAERTVFLRWHDPRRRLPVNQANSEEEELPLGLESRTDAHGFVTFCGLPPGWPLELHMHGIAADPVGRPARVAQWVLGVGAIEARTITIRQDR